MPQFTLNDTPAPCGYDALSDFAKGYVEAMFFTNGDTGDERENRLNEMGTARLTRASLAAIKRDCDRFQRENAASLEAAKELEPGSPVFRHARDFLDDARLGNLFWYARQGHGVGFDDDGDSLTLKELQSRARAFRETYVEIAHGWIHVR